MSDETSSAAISDAELPVTIRLADGNEATVDPCGGPTCMQFQSLPGPWQYHVDVASIGGMLGVIHLCVKQKHFIPSGLETPITSKGLRTVPVGRFLHAAREALRRQHGEPAAHPVETAPPPGSRKWPAEHYLQVASEYWRAQAAGLPPRQAIAARWNVSKVTASWWLRRARELRYVDDYERAAHDAWSRIRRLITPTSPGVSRHRSSAGYWPTWPRQLRARSARERKSLRTPSVTHISRTSPAGRCPSQSGS
jgi:hypothetical protein